MKALFLTLGMLVISGSHNIVTAQIPNWLWAKSEGGNSYDSSNDVAVDASGNVFITGFFDSPTITFGSTTLTNAGGSDIFIVKYNASGNVVWAKRAGGINSDIGNGISIDASGNVFITGRFQSPTITFGATTLTNAGFNDVFIVKYNTSGNVIWAKSEGGTFSEYSNDVSIDASGNVFITGDFQSPTITFGSTTLTNANAGFFDIFIVKYNASGNVLWAKSGGGTAQEYSNDVAMDASGNVCVTGRFFSPTITFGTTTLINAGSSNIFIVKYNASGNVVWAKSAGGIGDDYGLGISTDAGGNTIITGNFDSPTITFGSTTLTNAGGPDIFIVKYNTSGNVVWAKSAGGTSFDFSNSVSVDVTGNALITGGFQSPTITLGATTFTNAGGRDIIIVKYDAIGNVVWAKSEGGIGTELGNGVFIDPSGNVFITGSFESPTITFGTTTLTNAGLWEIFIAKLEETTGIKEQTDYSTIVIAPNPFTSQTTISFQEEQKNTTIKIVDVMGKVMKNLNFNGNQLLLEKGEMQPGIYFVQVIDENNNLANSRILIQ